MERPLKRREMIKRGDKGFLGVSPSPSPFLLRASHTPNTKTLSLSLSLSRPALHPDEAADGKERGSAPAFVVREQHKKEFRKSQGIGFAKRKLFEKFAKKKVNFCFAVQILNYCRNF